MRAVLDPNVLISALLAPFGAPGRALARWLAGDFELVVSERLLAELQEALAYPKLRRRVAEADAIEFVEFLRVSAVLAVQPEAGARRSRDPGDDYLLELAEAERAVVVTGDADLLALADELPIFAPAEFFESV